MLTSNENMIFKDGPDMGHVLSHLEFLAKHDAVLDPEYNLEIRAIKEGAPPRSKLINPTNDDGLEVALHFVDQTNRQGFNIYVTVSPSQPSGPHVKDEDILQIPFLFADADERGAVTQVKNDFIHRPDAYICTGTKPFERGHFIGNSKSQFNQLILKSGRSSCKTLPSGMAVIPKSATHPESCVLGEP